MQLIKATLLAAGIAGILMQPSWAYRPCLGPDGIAARATELSLRSQAEMQATGELGQVPGDPLTNQQAAAVNRRVQGLIAAPSAQMAATAAAEQAQADAAAANCAAAANAAARPIAHQP